jgi:hypothetical protein
VERNGQSVAFSAGLPMLACVGSLAGLAVSRSVESVFAGGVVGAAVAISAFVFLRLGALTPPREWSVSAGEVRALIPFSAIAVFGWLSGYGMTFVISTVFEPPAVARYTFLLTLASLAQMVASAMNMAWSPRFYHLYLSRGNAQAQEPSARFFRLQAYVLGVLAAMASTALPWVTQVAGGNLQLYGSLQTELTFLFVGYVLSIPWWHAQNYFFINNRGTQLMHIVVATGCLGTSLWIAGMLMFGEAGIYFGFLLQVAVRSAVAACYARRLWHAVPPWPTVAVASALPFALLLF